MQRMKLLGAAAAATMLFSGAQAFAGVTVGAANGGNCYPFSCGPTDGLAEYQEAYNQNAFPGITTFNTVSFTKFTAFESGTPTMDTGTYDVSFFLSTGPVNSLSANLPSNEGTFLGNLGTFTLGGAMPNVLSLTGSTITYDPTQGNLLMDVGITSGASFNGQYNVFFNADEIGGPDTARIWSPLPEGSNVVGALQTTFSNGVPEPATWAMMLLGAGLVGAGLRIARRRDVTALTTG